MGDKMTADAAKGTKDDTFSIDRAARWLAIQELAKRIAYKDESPTEVESALCGAVVQVKALIDALTAAAEQAEQQAARLNELQSSFEDAVTARESAEKQAEQLRGELGAAQMTVRNLELANGEARKTIDRLSAMCPQDACNGSDAALADREKG